MSYSPSRLSRSGCSCTCGRRGSGRPYVTRPDALWATMVTWWAGSLAPRARPAVRGVVAYAICLGIEVSQLYHAPAVDAVRATLVGRLVLGSGFDPRDLAAYAIGVASAVLLDMALIVRGRDPRAAI